VTWTLTEEGATVRKGDPIARVADLSAFRVEGTAADVNAPRMAVGLPVRVDVGDLQLRGSVSAIDPTIRDGVLTFTVALEDKSNAALRPNLRVDVFVFTEQKARALRVARGRSRRATVCRVSSCSGAGRHAARRSSWGWRARPTSR